MYPSSQKIYAAANNQPVIISFDFQAPLLKCKHPQEFGIGGMVGLNNFLSEALSSLTNSFLQWPVPFASS